MHMLRSYLWPIFEDDGDFIRTARKRLAHLLCLVAALVMTFFASWALIETRIVGDGTFYTLGYFTLPALCFWLAYEVSRNRRLNLASVTMIATSYIFTFLMRLESGFFTPGAVFFITIPMLAGMLIGVRAGAFCSVLVILTFVVALIFHDQLPPPRVAIGEQQFMIEMAVDFTLVGTVTAFCALFFMHMMRQVVARLNVANKELSEYKLGLELLVQARTRTIKEQAEKLETALEAQKEANMLQNTLVSVVSHEIRTPLAIIDGYARRMTRAPEKLSPSDISERAETIRKSVRRLTQLVERTLESARYAEGAIAFQSTRFSLKSLLETVVAREQDQSPFHQIDADLSALPDEYCGDENLLDHVFSNLISNAMKYAPENQLIEIRTRETCSGYDISIKDYGIGIPADELPRISSRFFRASTAKGINGTGVGLYLTRKITEDHGGSMDIRSAVGEWTEINIHLPHTSTVCINNNCHKGSEAA